MADTSMDITKRVEAVLREVLGYVPSPREDLSRAIDSMQKLELLIIFEEQFSVPFQDESLAADWWGTRDGIATYIGGATDQTTTSEGGDSTDTPRHAGGGR